MTTIIGSKMGKIIRLASDPSRIIPDDYTCCGENGCDGYGHVIGGSGAMPCPNKLAKVFMDLWDRPMRKHWSQYPLTFESIREMPGFKATQSFVRCEKYADTILGGCEPELLALCGGHGRSKTWSAIAAVRELILALRPALMVHFPSFMRRFRNLDKRGWCEIVFDRSRKADLVVIDDLGRERDYGNPHLTYDAIEEFFEICHEKRHLIVTCNFSMDGFLDYLPPNIRDRVSPAAGYASYVIEPENQSLRQTGVQTNENTTRTVE